MPFNNAITSSIGLIGTRVRSYATLLVLEAPFNGRTLYGSTEFGSNFGYTKNSKITITLGNLASIEEDCFSYFTTTSEPLTCLIAGSTITITSPIDITSSGSLMVHFRGVNPDASSTTFSFTLYSRYASGSDYAISLQDSVTHTFDRQSGKTILPRDQLQFHRFSPKVYLQNSINVKVRLQPSVTVAWNPSTSLIGAVTVAMSGLPAGVYTCWAKEFRDGNPFNYRVHPVPCIRSTNQLSFQPINGLSFESSRVYELVGYLLSNSAEGYVS